jgi:hypothetical protein
MSIIPGIGLEFEVNPHKVKETLYKNQIQNKRAGGMAQVV